MEPVNSKSRSIWISRQVVETLTTSKKTQHWKLVRGGKFNLSMGIMHTVVHFEIHEVVISLLVRNDPVDHVRLYCGRQA